MSDTREAAWRYGVDTQIYFHLGFEGTKETEWQPESHENCKPPPTSPGTRLKGPECHIRQTEGRNRATGSTRDMWSSSEAGGGKLQLVLLQQRGPIPGELKNVPVVNSKDFERHIRLTEGENGTIWSKGDLLSPKNTVIYYFTIFGFLELTF